jgi:23S rRNA pseudouridine1911/1915/1917 synthase
MTQNQGYSYRHIVQPDGVGHSSLEYFAKQFAHSTASEWRARFELGEIELDNQIANGLERLRAGMVLVWNRPGWLEADTPQKYGVLFQDEHLLVIDKPSGLPTIPGGGYYQNTLLRLVQRDFPEANPLHRLGRATSGLVLFALTAEVAKFLTEQWPQVNKQYQALSSFVALRDAYDIQACIGKCDHPLLGKVYAASEVGRAARSVARVKQRRENTTVFEVDLHTGRPHQIRIHLASIGHPLVGDPLYTIGGLPKNDQAGLPGDGGYYLHAKRLTFVHPLTNRNIEITSALPEILQAD